MDIDSLTLNHSTPSQHSDIIFSSSAHAKHFIAWVADNPDVVDEYNNPVHIWAKATASPRQLAVGKILRDGFTFVSGKVPREVKVQTNRRNGTLAVRYRGLAFVLFRVAIPPNNGAPHIIVGDCLPPGFPGLSQDDVTTARRMATEAIAAMRF